MSAPVVLRPVHLIGGRGDGLEVFVDHARRVYAHVVEVETKVYPAGTYGTSDGAEVVATVVDFDTYVRVDDHTFKLVGA